MNAKKVLACSLVLLLGLAAALAYANAKFKPSPLPEELNLTPKQLPEASLPKTVESLPRTVLKRDNDNLFSADRGNGQIIEEPAEKRQADRPQFELVGICNIGSETGAIIEHRNRTDATKKSRLYFSVGSDVGGGFLLDAVGEKSAILRRQNEVIELQVGRKRLANEVKKSRAVLEKQPVQVVTEGQPAKTGPSDSKVKP